MKLSFVYSLVNLRKKMFQYLTSEYRFLQSFLLRFTKHYMYCVSLVAITAETLSDFVLISLSDACKGSRDLLRSCHNKIHLV